ncbi:MAG: hypothetical protein IJR20_02120 [Muribaculaceae bacterium]|nr:hypothetical protein [Muribaculaceae bacterium]
MKRIIITMLVALMVIATTEAGPVAKAEPKKHHTEQSSKEKADKHATEQDEEKATETDQNSKDGEKQEDAKSIAVSDNVSITKDAVIVKNKDGETVKMKVDDLGKFINNHLDDTLLKDDGLTVEVDGENIEKMEVGSGPYNIAQDGMDLARDISTAFFISIVWIVGLSLLFYYLHRRRKYKTVDRAIQAGYPLPDEFFGKRSQPMPQQPTTVYVTQVPPMQQPANGAQPADGAQPAAMPNYGHSSNPLNNITDWTPFKSGLRTTAIGLGLLFFFWILGVTPLAALMVIVIFIGLGKLFIAYQEQQNMKNYWQQQQWAQQPPQQQQRSQQAQQPQDGGQNIPPMPETPPEFDPNK